MAKSKYPKAITLFIIREGFEVSFEQVTQAVERFRLRPLDGDISRVTARGFLPVMAGDNAPLVHCVGGFFANSGAGGFYLKFAYQEKVVPSDCVRRKLALTVAEIEKSGSRFVRGKERQALECEIIEEMAVNAPVRQKEFGLMMLPSKRLMAVFASSAADVDNATSLLRKALGSLPVVPYSLNDFTGFNCMVTGYTEETNRRIFDANAMMDERDIATPVFSVGRNVALSNMAEKVRFAGFRIDHESVVHGVRHDGLSVASVELGFSNAFTGTFHGFEKITGLKWHLDSSEEIDCNVDATASQQGADSANAPDESELENLVFAADLELLSGVIADLDEFFYPIFGNRATFEQKAASEGQA